jgi:hypothetical protein
LDLTGKGISTVNKINGVNFDLLGNGQTEKTGWISEGQGLLMLDTNNNSKLDNGAELFGQGSTLSNGLKAETGYQALSELDTNHDGVINSQDTAFNQLRVWVDTGNANGSATGQIETLSQLGITQLNLNAQASTQYNNGNLVGLVSSYQTDTGKTGAMADVWFTAQASPNTNSTVMSDIPAAGLSSGSLSINVNDLANAISSFNQGTQSPISTTIPLNTGSTSTAPLGIFSSNALSTLTALSQFNANGQSVVSNTPTSANQVSAMLNSTGMAVTSDTNLFVANTKKSS